MFSGILESTTFQGVVCYLTVTALWMVVYRFFFAPGFNLKGKHVFVTGGSTGLGLAFAKLCLTKGASVTIIARSQPKLDAAVKELKPLVLDGQSVAAISCDVVDINSVTHVIKELPAPVDVLVSCAGTACPGFFREQGFGIFKRQMEVNYLGSVNVAKVVLDHMIANNVQDGRFIFVSSTMGLLSFVGYSQYAATKQAVRGFCDGIRGELKSLYGYSTHIFFAANIDSPGFVEEQKTKPEITQMIEGTASLQSCEDVALALYQGIELGQYQITNDIGSEVLRIVNNGVNPRNNFLLEIFVAPLILVIQHGFHLFIEVSSMFSLKKEVSTINKKED